jgi:hypothetical protein
MGRIAPGYKARRRLELDQYFQIITYPVLVGENASMPLANTFV